MEFSIFIHISLRMPPAKSALLSQQVYDALYESMLSNRLQPGDEINRRQVASDLGVSVAPVLEAMTQLEWEGFLETRPRRGTTVKTVTVRQVLGRMRLRTAIEAEAARTYAGPSLAAVKDRMLALAAKLDATAKASEASIAHEVAFHRALVELAECPVLTETFDHVMRHSLYHAAARLLPECPPRQSQVHVRLVKDLLAARPEQAERLIREHLAPWLTALSQAAEDDARWRASIQAVAAPPTGAARKTRNKPTSPRSLRLLPARTRRR